MKRLVFCCLVVVCCAVLTGSCGRSSAGIAERAAHWWDGVDFADTTLTEHPEALEERFAAYVGLLEDERMDPATAGPLLRALLGTAAASLLSRRRTAGSAVAAFAAARAAGHTNINMDLIAGLPGDTVEGFTASLRQAIALDPENITVHTLTLKRASNLVVEHRAAAYDDVSAMLESCRELADVGYRPYYMYRQKGTLQNLENIGWAKPGCECLYNIYIMEEIHTILSAGAGGSTKLVIPGQRRGKIERIFNFKYPTEYIDRFEEILARKQGVEDFYARYTTT